MTPTLYDVRVFPAKYPRTLGPSSAGTIGLFVATVREVPGALRDWPDLSAVRAGLKPQWRKAFDRAGQFWADKHDDSRPLSLTLYDRRGALLGTLYATRRAA